MSLFVILTVHTLVYNMRSDSHVTDTEDLLRRMVTHHQKKKKKLNHRQAERVETVGKSEKRAELKF